MLTDLLGPGLTAVICGTAAGRRSWTVRAYYADPTNQFWRILAREQLTPYQLRPEEYRDLLRYGIGLTDLVHGHAGTDTVTMRIRPDVEELLRKLRVHRPTLIGFNGKRAAEAALGRRVGWGLQADALAGAAVWVLPSTSGAARRYWEPRIWADLACAVRAACTPCR